MNDSVLIGEAIWLLGNGLFSMNNSVLIGEAIWLLGKIWIPDCGFDRESGIKLGEPVLYLMGLEYFKSSVSYERLDFNR